MKFFKRKGEERTIRFVKDDDGLMRYGILGTVRDFLEVGILDSCDVSSDFWVFVCVSGEDVLFCESREDLIETISKSFGI